MGVHGGKAFDTELVCVVKGEIQSAHWKIGFYFAAAWIQHLQARYFCYDINYSKLKTHYELSIEMNSGIWCVNVYTHYQIAQPVSHDSVRRICIISTTHQSWCARISKHSGTFLDLYQ